MSKDAAPASAPEKKSKQQKANEYDLKLLVATAISMRAQYGKLNEIEEQTIAEEYESAGGHTVSKDTVAWAIDLAASTLESLKPVISQRAQSHPFSSKYHFEK